MKPTPNTADYKLGYSRGYAAGTRDKWDAEARRQRDLSLVAQRAERAEAAAGIGHCDGCTHWDRPEGCAWGYCNASRQPGSPWGCWAQGSFVNEKYDKGRISTTPKFGACCSCRASPQENQDEQCFRRRPRRG